MSAAERQKELFEKVSSKSEIVSYLEKRIDELMVENQRLVQIIEMYAEIAVASANLTNEVFGATETDNPDADAASDPSSPPSVEPPADHVDAGSVSNGWSPGTRREPLAT
jgi:hypothetical protein